MGSNEPVRNECEVIYEMFHILNCGFEIKYAIIFAVMISFSGFIAQLVGASHRYREVTGSNPVEVLTFSGFFSQLLKLRS